MELYGRFAWTVPMNSTAYSTSTSRAGHCVLISLLLSPMKLYTRHGVVPWVLAFQATEAPFTHNGFVRTGVCTQCKESTAALTRADTARQPSIPIAIPRDANRVVANVCDSMQAFTRNGFLPYGRVALCISFSVSFLLPVYMFYMQQQVFIYII